MLTVLPQAPKEDVCTVAVVFLRGSDVRPRVAARVDPDHTATLAVSEVSWLTGWEQNLKPLSKPSLFLWHLVEVLVRIPPELASGEEEGHSMPSCLLLEELAAWDSNNHSSQPVVSRCHSGLLSRHLNPWPRLLPRKLESPFKGISVS